LIIILDSNAVLYTAKILGIVTIEMSEDLESSYRAFISLIHRSRIIRAILHKIVLSEIIDVLQRRIGPSYTQIVVGNIINRFKKMGIVVSGKISMKALKFLPTICNAANELYNKGVLSKGFSLVDKLLVSLAYSTKHHLITEDRDILKLCGREEFMKRVSRVRVSTMRQLIKELKK